MPNIQRERERERVKRVKAGLIVLCLILLVFTVVEASPPGSAYVPGETLAPSCSPGDTNCKVALTSGSVLFSNGTDLITQDNSNFYWDDTNNRLGIGTTTPSYKLTILGDLFVNTSSTLGNVISGVWQGTAIGDSYISSAATWNAKITTSSLSVAYGPLSYNNATGVFSFPTSTASQSGYLSSADWTTFNAKITTTTLSASAPIVYNNQTGAFNWTNSLGYITTTTLSVAYPPLAYNNTTGIFTLPTSTASQSGFLSSADWTTFNNKATSTLSLTAGSGLTGGGNLTADRTFTVGAGTGITVNDDDVALTVPVAISSGGTGTTTAPSIHGQLLMASSTGWTIGSLIAGSNITLTTSTPSQITIAATGGAPGGSNTQIQFNNSGSFLGDSNFTWASSTQLLTITGTSTISGNLGVGTTTPTYKLTINSSNATDNLFQVATTTNQGIFVINSSGNVGIGTTTPSQTLSVAGNVLVSGTSTFTNQVGILAVTGVAPLSVDSTTKVANLNADMLDGFDSSAFGDATAANQTTILSRIGTNADAASMSSTLFAGQEYIGNQVDNAYSAAITLTGIESAPACPAGWTEIVVQTSAGSFVTNTSGPGAYTTTRLSGGWGGSGRLDAFGHGLPETNADVVTDVAVGTHSYTTYTFYYRVCGLPR